MTKAADYADLKTTDTAITRSFCHVVGITGGSA